MSVLDKQQINGAVVHILLNGPTRVVVKVEKRGRQQAATHCVPPAEAEQRHGIRPEVVLIRSDGWSLGVQERHAEAAHRTWDGQWAAVLNLRTSEVVFADECNI